jgi:hypothetical protein
MKPPLLFLTSNTAKRAYLSLILNPPTGLPYPAMIRPYDGPDSTAIIHSVNARTHGHGSRASFSQAGGAAQARASFSQAPPTGPSHAPFGNVATSSAQPFGTIGGGGNGHKHGRSASLSSTSGNHERPNFGSIGGSAAGSAAFNKLGASGAFGAFGTGSLANSGPSGSSHVRNASSGGISNPAGSWGRQSGSSGLTGQTVSPAVSFLDT